MISETVTPMKKLKFLVSLTTNDNDYQIEQAAAADEAARRLGVDVQIIYAENDSITQSQQILSVIQSRSDAHPDGIIFEPVGGTALPQVARAAVSAGISWVVLNRNVDYIAEIRKSSRVPIFGVSSDHEEIGRIQGHQFAAFLPKGGTVLHIQGPSESLAAKQRATGMYETKPADVQVKVMRAQWTEISSYRAVSSWLRLSTSHQTRIDLMFSIGLARLDHLHDGGMPVRHLQRLLSRNQPGGFDTRGVLCEIADEIVVAPDRAR